MDLSKKETVLLSQRLRMEVGTLIKELLDVQNFLEFTIFTFGASFDEKSRDSLTLSSRRGVFVFS